MIKDPLLALALALLLLPLLLLHGFPTGESRVTCVFRLPPARVLNGGRRVRENRLEPMWRWLGMAGKVRIRNRS
jgi:hypothetical protein